MSNEIKSYKTNQNTERKYKLLVSRMKIHVIKAYKNEKSNKIIWAAYAYQFNNLMKYKFLKKNVTYQDV